jgi:effector-binding domain-containing protein
MKKRIIIIVFILLTAFILYAALFKTVFHKEIKINSAIPVIHREISSLDKIARWFEPYSTADTNTNKIIKQGSLEYTNVTLKITKVVGFSAWYQVDENKRSENLLFEVMPDTGHYATVRLSYKNTLWNEIFSTNEIINNAVKSLQNLKDYLADNKKMYGYEVELISVTDTAFLFTSKVVANPAKKASFKNLFESLIKFAELKNLGYNGVRIFYTLPNGKDSIHLFTSIGITKPEDAPYTGDFTLKRMPYMGKLLKSYYQGSFGNVISALDAIAQFQSDNGMNSMAIPFVKLITEGIEFDDSQIIQANALYPVY